MATEAQATHSALHPQRASGWKDLVRKEDWWAVWLGLGLTLAAVVLFLQGSSIKWLAVTPKKWDHFGDALVDLRANAVRYLALFAMWAVLLGAGARTLGWKLREFLPSFVFVLSSPSSSSPWVNGIRPITTILSPHWWLCCWGS